MSPRQILAFRNLPQYSNTLKEELIVKYLLIKSLYSAKYLIEGFVPEKGYFYMAAYNLLLSLKTRVG